MMNTVPRSRWFSTRHAGAVLEIMVDSIAPAFASESNCLRGKSCLKFKGSLRTKRVWIIVDLKSSNFKLDYPRKRLLSPAMAGVMLSVMIPSTSPACLVENHRNTTTVSVTVETCNDPSSNFSSNKDDEYCAPIAMVFDETCRGCTRDHGRQHRARHC
jgi:hypothetical protein